MPVHSRLPSSPGARFAPALALLACLLALLTLPGGADAALTWNGPVSRDTAGIGPGLTRLACPSATTCVAVTSSAGVVTFNPAAPVASTPVPIDTVSVTALACVSTSLCDAVDAKGNVITFAPSAPGSAKVTGIDPGNQLTAIDCVPGGSTCVAVDSAANAFAFDPAAPGAPAADNLELGQRLLAVSCPDATLCVALDAADNEIVFDPTKSGATTTSTIDLSGNLVTALTCPSDQLCLAFDAGGNELITSPQAPSFPASVALDPNGIVAATCPTTSSCTAIDVAGNAVSFAPGQSPGTLTPVAAPKTLESLACPSVCVIGDAQGHVHRFTGAGSVPSDALIDSASAFSAVTCVSGDQCTAMDNFGDAVTFDPSVPGPPQAAVAVDPNADIVYDLACPLATQCTAVDDLGQAVTFNPQAPAGATVTPIVTGHALEAISCPAVTQCTVVEDGSYAATFNPLAPVSAHYVSLRTPSGTSIVDVSCPNPQQCTALDGAGAAITWNPQAALNIVRDPVLPDAGIALACPTASECIALGAGGERATFAPVDPGQAVTAKVATARPLALACPSSGYCVGLEDGGRTFEFDPDGTGTAAAPTTGDSADVSDLACPAVTRCVTVDLAGTVFTGTQPLGPVPAPVAPPAILGSAIQGGRLTATTGAWTGVPTSFATQWQLCNAAGQQCRSIDGATTSTLPVGPADAGHTVRVLQTASNPFGAGQTQASPPDGPIPGVHGPVVTRARLTVPASGPARLLLAFRASVLGPALRAIAVRLPPGVRLAGVDPKRSTSVITVPARRSVIVRGAKGGFALVIPRSATSLRLTLRGPRLAIARGLRRRIRARRTVRLLVTLSLGSRKSQQTTVALSVSR